LDHREAGREIDIKDIKHIPKREIPNLNTKLSTQIEEAAEAFRVFACQAPGWVGRRRGTGYWGSSKKGDRIISERAFPDQQIS
jgi:hypothetical protein